MKRMLNQNLIDFLNSLGDSLKYESSSNTVELGSNLFVDGIATFKADIKSYNGSGLYLYDNEGDSENVNVYADVGSRTLNIDYNNDDNPNSNVGIQIPLLDNAIALTTANTKTLFGNQSLEGTGNIDLYVHYLHIIINDISYYGTVYSSNNLVANSLQNLTTLMKSDGQIFLVSESDFKLIGYVGGVWKDIFTQDVVTAVSDNVTPI